jgi:hypothetical protein
LGWPPCLGVSGAAATGRSGFGELAAQVGLGQVGIVLALEVSRLAHNNADWYRLLDLAGRSIAMNEIRPRSMSRPCAGSCGTPTWPTNQFQLVSGTTLGASRCG